MKLCPRFDKPLLGPWQSPGYQLDWIETKDTDVFLVVGV